MTREEYLKHHGIKGQQWGHKSGPPYPLDAKAHSASEKKAGYQKSLEKDVTKTASKLNQNQKTAKKNAVLAGGTAAGALVAKSAYSAAGVSASVSAAQLMSAFGTMTVASLAGTAIVAGGIAATNAVIAANRRKKLNFMINT